MLNPRVGRYELLRTSFHQMQRGTVRSAMDEFERSARYIEDIFCMACLDMIIGQRDHKEHSYMVTSVGNLLPFDNQISARTPLSRMRSARSAGNTSTITCPSARVRTAPFGIIG